MHEIGHFIGGKPVGGTSGRSGDLFNPNTGEVQAKVSFADKSEVEAAIANAEAAQPAWAAVNPQRRARVLFRFLELVQREFDNLAKLLSSEHGKTIADSKGDIQRGLEVVEFACGIPRLRAIGFVGSSAIAEYIYATGCAHGKRVQCFGGAKNHMVVMPDADMDQAVDALIGAGYGSAGERCMAVSVAVPVGKKTADILVEKLIPRVESLKIGPSSDPQADYGPMVTKAQLDKVKSYVDLGIKEGAKLKVDGRGFKLQGYEGGFFMGGCLFDEVTPEMRIYKEEIFGPVLSVVRAKTYEEALRLPSEHDYGNGVAIFTRDGDTARDFAARVNVGMVGVNFAIPVPLSYYTFGGWKRSGFGDLNQHGPDSVRFYTKTKTVTSRWPPGIKEGAEFVIPTMR